MYMLRLIVQAVLNTKIQPGSWLVVVGAGGGLGHLAGMFEGLPRYRDGH